MATKTIGTGGDYATYALWASYLDGLGTLTEPEVGEQLNEELSVAGNVCNLTGFTPDATNTLTVKCAAGASFRDNANAATNALRYNSANGAAVKAASGYSYVFQVDVPHVRFEGLQIKADINATTVIAGIVCTSNGTNCTVDYCIIESQVVAVTLDDGGTIRNSVVVGLASSTQGVKLKVTSSIYNTTIVKPSGVTAGGDGIVFNYVTNAVVQNCAVFGYSNYGGGAGTFSIDYGATDLATIQGSGTHNLTSLTYADQFEDSATDFRLKLGSDLIDAGNTDSTNAANDIVGTARPSGSAYDIGAWEFASAPASATTYTLEGPSTGTVGVASSDITVTPDAAVSADVTVTFSDGGDGGTFSNATVTFASGTSTPQTTTYTPASAGVKTISTTNDGGLTDPASVSFTASAAAATVIPPPLLIGAI